VNPAAGIAWVVARGIASGVGQMLRAARGLAQGDIEQHIAVRSRDEIGAMAVAFEEMIAYNREMAGHAGEIAAGDLTITVTPKGDRDALGVAFAEMVTNLRGLVSEVNESAGVLGSASQQMASTSEETGHAVGEIASAVSDVAQGAERQVRMPRPARRSRRPHAPPERARRRPARPPRSPRRPLARLPGS
jgi:methyl-accepting chemotaxis protein